MNKKLLASGVYVGEAKLSVFICLSVRRIYTKLSLWKSRVFWALQKNIIGGEKPLAYREFWFSA